MISRDLAALILGRHQIADLNLAMFDQYSFRELRKMWNVSKALRKKIDAYTGPYFLYALSAGQNKDLQKLKRALALAVNFKPEYVKCILNQHPDLLNCVLETRTVTVAHPDTKQRFTAKWHFKLSHLLASEGCLKGLSDMMERFKKNTPKMFDSFMENDKFFGEHICWEAEDKNKKIIRGEKGPTVALIAILYQQEAFFCQIPSGSRSVAFSQECDEPYNTMHPCDVLLRQVSKRTAWWSQVYISEAIMKESDRLIEYLLDEVSAAVEENNLKRMKLFSVKVNTRAVLIDNWRGDPVRSALGKARRDESHLPLVKHFLSCGYLAKFSNLQKILRNPWPCDRQSAIAKLNTYFEMARIFSSEAPYCKSESLVGIAWRDREFFNELIVACLPDGEDEPINKTFVDKASLQRFITCLREFHEWSQWACSYGETHLTAETWERIQKAAPANEDSQPRHGFSPRK
jgi:hypothetical protein